MGLVDRGIRFVIGSLFVYFGFFDHSLIKDTFAGALIGIMGAIFIAVSLAAYCPAYVLIGLSTIRRKLPGSR